MDNRFKINGSILEKYNGRSEDVYVPLGVKRISYGVFSERKSIRNIVFPEGLESLDAHAFWGCDRLETVWLPDSLRVIEEGCFYGCTALKSVRVSPQIERIAPSAFDSSSKDVIIYCDATDLSAIPKLIKWAAVKGFLESVSSGEKHGAEVLKAYREYIKKQRKRIMAALGDHEPLYTYLINESLISPLEVDDLVSKTENAEIRGRLLEYKAKAMTPQLLQRLERAEERRIDRMFSGKPPLLSEMKEIFGLKKLEDGTYEITSYKGEETEVTVPPIIGKCNVSSIGDGAFSPLFSFNRAVRLSGTVIRSVTISEGIKSIGHSAFMDCDGLSFVSLPQSLTSIGARAFFGCSALKDISFPSGLTSVGAECLEGTEYARRNGIGAELYNGEYLLKVSPLVIGDVRVREGTKRILEMAFDSCMLMNSVQLPSGLSEIGERAFVKCSGLERINIPSSVKKIGSYAFSESKRLKIVRITSLDSWLDIEFCGSGATPLDGKAVILLNGSPITEITLPEGTKKIGDHQLEGFRDLKRIYIPDSVTEIGEKAFCGCASLESVRLGQNVKKIGKGAFYGCTSLKSIELPVSITEIEDDTFFGAGLKALSVPDGVRSLGDHAVMNCGFLKKVKLPKTLERIGDGAFMNCIALDEISIPSRVSVIPKNTFCGCMELRSVRLPMNVKEISALAFTFCQSLTLEVDQDSRAMCYAEIMKMRYKVL